MNAGEFEKKAMLAGKGSLDCIRATFHGPVEIVVWTGGVEVGGEPVCFAGPRDDLYLDIAARSDSIREIGVLYTAACRNEVLRFKRTQKPDHTAVLYTIPLPEAVRGLDSPPSYDHEPLERNPEVNRPQEIIRCEFLLEPAPRNLDTTAALSIAVGIEP